VDFGDFEMRGPTTQVAECVVGATCTPSFVGIGLDTFTSTFFAGGCGSPYVEPIISFQGLTTDVPTDVSGTQYVGAAIATGSVPLCWQAGAGLIRVAGEFHFVGFDQQDIVCTLGARCAPAIAGHRLRETSFAKVTPGRRCGANALAMTGFRNPAQITYAGAPYVSAYAFDMRTATAGTPGVFGLCASHNPAGPQDYFRLGTFVLHGPYEATFLCNVGEPCYLTVTGVGLSSENSVLIFSNANPALECGDPYGSAADWHGTNFSNPNGPVPASTSTESVYYFGIVNNFTVDAPGGGYKACWSPSGSLQTAHVVQLTSNAQLHGAAAAHLACTLGQPCNMTIGGFGQLSTNSILLLANSGNCGSARSTVYTAPGLINPVWAVMDGDDAIFFFGTPTAGAVGDSYTVCWASAPPSLAGPFFDVTSGACVVDESGCLTHPGYPAAYTNNEACTVTVTGDAIMTATAFSTESCCDHLHIGSEIFSGSTGPGGLFVAEGTTILWSTDFSVTDGGFRLCAEAGTRVQTLYSSTVDFAGEIFGPHVQDLSCTLGVECTLQLQTYGATAPSSGLLVISAESTSGRTRLS
jgi:hypothetical protein